MRKLFTALALTGLLGITACTDAYGRPDPVTSALLGVGVGAVVGLAVGSASQPRHQHHYYQPRPVYRGHVYRGPVYRGHYAPPRGYYRPRGYHRY